MPTLSVIMIVKNEAKCLEECLSSIRGIADEIVVADTGSSDGTRDLAAILGGRVFSLEWKWDFAAARNETIRAASGDWLLHMDADEVLDPDNARRIREIVDADGVAANGTRADAIELTLANYCDDMRAWRWRPAAPGDPWARGHAGYIGVGLLRLFRNRMGYEYREPVHENITESVLEKGGTVRAEPIVIHHYGYACEPDRAKAKAKTYFEIAHIKVVSRPDDPKAWLDLAEQSLACGDAKTAEEAARRALELRPHDLAASTTLGNLLLNRGDLEEARLLFEGIVEHGVQAPHVLTALGAIACKQGDLEAAGKWLAQALEAQPNALQAMLYLARVYDRKGDLNKAREMLQTAKDAAPGIQELRERLQAHDLREKAENQFAVGQHQTALFTLVQALRMDPEDPLIHNDTGVVLAALGRKDKARESFERALLLAPGLPEAVENLQSLK